MGGSGGVGFGGGGPGGCERRIEVFVKIQKKKIFFFLGGGGGSGSGWGGQGGCDRRIESFGKIHTKKNSGGGGVGRGQVGGRVGVFETRRLPARSAGYCRAMRRLLFC